MMNTKLTLNLNKSVIESAKEYAKEKSISLSKLIESYLNSLTKKDSRKVNVSPLVESLTGIITAQPENDDYYDYLRKKYSWWNKFLLTPISFWICSKSGKNFTVKLRNCLRSVTRAKRNSMFPHLPLPIFITCSSNIWKWTRGTRFRNSRSWSKFYLWTTKLWSFPLLRISPTLKMQFNITPQPNTEWMWLFPEKRKTLRTSAFPFLPQKNIWNVKV